ncbi:hypothetical protein LB521_27825 [Mesorhizobium sp. BR-1-1-8]|uniref:hypothetical protein n=1 Tax=unclassified Mesorhizobium TaxID=325217 RepID=UPI001CCF364B|nr:MULTISPECIES: hypothetical protein [unclassified Mesorhizobium]MBZ9973494.1 hypothetical protein [Mesorhizobium sp. BR1-1-12]MBZ9984947.1 hypothetical protein [Mesorhizobium sp. BR-1-1-8]
MHSFKTFSDALTAIPVAANDNKPTKAKPRKRIRNNSTLPALRWLYDNYPELAEPVAEAVQALAQSNWDSDAIDNDQEIRPTVGELMRAATDRDTGAALTPTIQADADGNPYVALGTLKFVRGELVEYGRTKKGRKLEPRDRIASRAEEPSKERNPNRYVFHTGGTPSPLHAQPHQRPFSGEPALVPMYDPQKGVEANRAVLRSFGVDGSVAFEDLPFPATRCPTAIAKGAEFLGGVVGSGGTSSSGALMWEAPEVVTGDAIRVIEEVAARGTLQSIGEIVCGNAEAGKEALLDAARVLVAANDNKKREWRSA